MGLGMVPQYNTLEFMLKGPQGQAPEVIRSLRTLKLQSDMDCDPRNGLKILPTDWYTNQVPIDGVEVK